MAFLKHQPKGSLSNLICQLLILSLLGICHISLAKGIYDLKYMAEDYAPANYLENGQLKGHSVEILKLIWKKLGIPQQKIVIYPWARGYSNLKTKKNHVLFTMSRTPERENLFKWVGPIGTAKQVLISMVEKRFSIQNMADIKELKIGVIIDDVAGEFLKESGFGSNLQSTSKLDINIKKLRYGRLDFIAYSQKGFYDFLKHNGIHSGEFKTAFTLHKMGLYYAFHKDTSDTVIQKFQTALDSLRKEHMVILKNYNLSLQ